jgi:hypothetical protein
MALGLDLPDFGPNSRVKFAVNRLPIVTAQSERVKVIHIKYITFLPILSDQFAQFFHLCDIFETSSRFAPKFSAATCQCFAEKCRRQGKAADWSKKQS